jgi:hypothetical protein
MIGLKYIGLNFIFTSVNISDTLLCIFHAVYSSIMSLSLPVYLDLVSVVSSLRRSLYNDLYNKI